MPEPQISVKIVSGRFVSCWPMVEPRPDQRTFLPNPARHPSHRISPAEPEMLNYALTKEDHNDTR